MDISSNFYYVNVYIKTHLRATSYIFGIIFGYVVHRIQIRKYNFFTSLLKNDAEVLKFLVSN